jgi:hypothetical protein
MNLGYYAVERFSPKDNIAWNKYIEFSKLEHLKEVITLDGCLCPSIIDHSHDCNCEFVKWIDDQYCGAAVFNNLEWVIESVKLLESKQILLLSYEPDEYEFQSFKPEGFTFCGFDLVDHIGGISALLNCGGFDKAFSSHDLSYQGLITNLNKARKIQELLCNEYPDEGHAQCQLWGIWRYEE